MYRTLAGLCLVVSCVSTAIAAPTVTLYGTAQISPTADPARPFVFDVASAQNPFTAGAVGFTPSSPLTFGAITQLSADYNAQLGQFGGGSPRFSIGLDVNNNNSIDGFAFIYFGTHPNFNDAPPLNTWLNTGNLRNAVSVDTSQLPGGAFYDFNAFTNFAAANVLDIYLVVDGGWNGSDRFFFDNIRINNDLITGASLVPEPASIGVWSVLGLAGVAYRWRRKRAT